MIGAGGWELPNWVRDYERFWARRATGAAQYDDAAAASAARRHSDHARVFGQYLADLTQQYQISYIQLDEELGIDMAGDTFTQLNSRVVRLDVFDLMNALLKPKGLQLKHIWRIAAPRLEFVATAKMNVYILQVMSIVRQAFRAREGVLTSFPTARK